MNPMWETIAQIAERERVSAIQSGDYAAALVSALVEIWANDALRRY